MKLCIVSSGDFFSNYGGGQVYVRNIVDDFCRRQEITTIVVSFCERQVFEKKKYNGIDVFSVNNEQTFREVLLKTKPDIVHSNGEKYLSAKLCKELEIPCIVTAHHGGLVCPAGTLLNTDDEICNIPADFSHCLKCYLRHTPTGLFWFPLLKRYSQKRYIKIGKRLKRLPFIPFLSPIGETGLIVSEKIAEWKELADNVTHFIAPSNAIAEALKRNGCPKSKISVIPHGIPQQHHIPSSPFSVLRSPFIKFYYVGRINYVKGIHILLKAFSSIEDPNIELHLIGGAGNNAEQRYMKRLQRQYRKDTRIIWHGKLPLEQMNEAIKDYHCLIHPAIYLEVFGLNISEALSQHKYVIATRCGGSEMQIHNENEGILVNPNNPEELKDAMIHYINSPKHSTAEVERIETHIQNLIKLYFQTTKEK